MTLAESKEELLANAQVSRCDSLEDKGVCLLWYHLPVEWMNWWIRGNLGGIGLEDKMTSNIGYVEFQGAD